MYEEKAERKPIGRRSKSLALSIKPDIDYQCVDDIFMSANIGEIKAVVAAFIVVADEVRETYNGMFAYALCQRLGETFSEWAKRYSTPAKGSSWNAVIIPPEHSLIMLLPSCAPFGSAPVDVIAGLKSFIECCDDFIPPVHDAISVSEMKRVLTIAQKSFRLIDIITPDEEPLKILRFYNSHKVYNSQCAIPVNNKQAVIYSFHPNKVDIHDRIFVFAHELGHALHLSLTHDIDVLPDGFDKFNDTFSPKPETLKDKQEMFSDAVAIAILNAKGLGTHFPTRFSKDMSYLFANYVRGLCEDTLQKSGRYSEPLPPPNTPFKTVLRPPR